MEVFSQFGNVVDVKVITERETGRSRGFGFVTYEEDQDAALAKQNMDGATLDSRTIRVNEAEDRREGGGGGGGGGGGSRPPRSGPPRSGGGPRGGGGGRDRGDRGDRGDRNGGGGRRR